MGRYMLTKKIFLAYLVLNALRNETTGFKSFYGIKTNDHPKSSCDKIANIISAGRCLATCGIIMDKLVMISHDKSRKICMCCNNITGSDITSSNWTTYIPPPCGDGYATYDLMSHQICLKYFPVPSTYSSARLNCHAEGGYLIKIDSQEKCNIFNDYHNNLSIANNSKIQVWVQGEKINGQWQFEDGTLVSDVCPINSTNDGATEVLLQARGSTSFSCINAPSSDPYHYSCEYNRLLSFNT